MGVCGFVGLIVLYCICLGCLGAGVFVALRLLLVVCELVLVVLFAVVLTGYVLVAWCGVAGGD